MVQRGTINSNVVNFLLVVEYVDFHLQIITLNISEGIEAVIGLYVGRRAY